MVDQELSRTEQYRRFDERVRAVLPSSTLDRAPGGTLVASDVAVIESAIKDYGFGHAEILRDAPNPHSAALELADLIADRPEGSSSTWTIWFQGCEFLSQPQVDDEGAEHAINSVMEHLWSVPSAHMQPKVEVSQERMAAAERLRKVAHVRTIKSPDKSTLFLGALAREVAHIQIDEYAKGYDNVDLAVVDLAIEVMNILHDSISEYALIRARTSN